VCRQRELTAITTPWPERQTLNSIFVDKYTYIRWGKTGEKG